MADGKRHSCKGRHMVPFPIDSHICHVLYSGYTWQSDVDGKRHSCKGNFIGI